MQKTIFFLVISALSGGMIWAADMPVTTTSIDAVPVIAVLPFTNLVPDPEFISPLPPDKANDINNAFNTTNWISFGLPELILLKLTASKQVGVVQSYVLNIAHKKLDKEYTSDLDETTIYEVDDLVGTNWMVSGKYDKKVDSNDRIIVSGRYPKFQYSINGNASWKGIDFSLKISCADSTTNF